MEPINFLPDKYARRAARQALRARKALAATLGVAALAAFGLVNLRATRAASDELDHYRQQAADASIEVRQRGLLRAEEARLNHRLTIHDELSLPIPGSTVLAAVIQLMPDDIGLTRLEVIAERPDPTPAEAEKPGRSRVAHTNDASEGDTPEDQLRITLSGIGPDDATIGRFVDALNDHELFTSIAFQESRGVEQDGLIGRSFTLALEVDLHREFNVAPGGGVVDAH